MRQLGIDAAAGLSVARWVGLMVGDREATVDRLAGGVGGCVRRELVMRRWVFSAAVIGRSLARRVSNPLAHSLFLPRRRRSRPNQSHCPVGESSCFGHAC